MSRFSCVLSLFLASYATPSMRAQEEQARPAFPEGWSAEAEVRTAILDGGDLESSSGEVDTWITEAKFRVQGWAWPFGRLGFNVGHEHRRYWFRGEQPFFPVVDDPWKDVHTVNLGIQLLQGLTKEWGVFLGANAKASAGVDADLADGISGLFIAGIGYDFGNGFRAGVGAVGLARFEDSFRVFPAIQFDWQIDEQWRAKLEGLRFDLSYRIDSEWMLGIGAEVDGIRFRLPKSPVVDEGIVQDQRLASFFRVQWTPLPALDIELEAGVDLWRRIRVENENGNSGSTYSSDPAPFISLGVTFQF